MSTSKSGEDQVLLEAGVGGLLLESGNASGALLLEIGTLPNNYQGFSASENNAGIISIGSTSR